MGAAILIGGIVVAVAGYVIVHTLAGLVSKEATGWAPHVNRGIVRRASRLLPEEHRDRWLEEWESDVSEFDDRPLSGTVHALMAAAGARRLARELQPVSVAARTSGGVSTIGRRGSSVGSALAARVGRLGVWLRGLGSLIPTRLLKTVAPVTAAAGIPFGLSSLVGVFTRQYSPWIRLSLSVFIALGVGVVALMIVQRFWRR